MKDRAESLFDLTRVPFSYHGSWVSIGIPRNHDDLVFRNHHGAANNLFELVTLAENEEVRADLTAHPWKLVLDHAAGQIEICFESTGTVRMRGRGLSLQFGRKNLVYSEAPDRFVMNCPRTRRYQVDVLHGTFELRQLVATQPVYPRVAVVQPGEDGCWEVAVDEFWSTWVRPARGSLDDCLASAQQSFDAFLAAMPAVRPQDEAAHKLAVYIDWATTVGPCGHIKRPSLLMSKCWMSNVWSWDHCFNAMALAKGHPELALDQMLTMADHQDAFGCYPDSINDTWKHFNFAKPPVHGWALSEILERMPGAPCAETAQTLYKSLSAQANWWLDHRVLEMKGSNGVVTMPYYLHGNDSGWDNSTMFMQGVPLVAPDLSALLILQMDALAERAAGLGRGDEAGSWKRRADGLYERLMQELWVGDHFVARLGKDGSAVECRSLIPWLPIILGQRLPVEVRECLKAGLAGHLTDWGLATERVDSPKYRTDGYWQGPIWAPATYIAVTGLDRCGFTDLADEVSERFCRLCAKSGFAENFDAVTGDPLCDPAYTWTASVFILLAERLAGKTAK